MTTENQSTWWIKYSEYQIEKDENGTEYVTPTLQAVALAYDVGAQLGKNVQDLVAIANAPEEERVMMFVKRFGLMGVAMEEELDHPSAHVTQVASAMKSAFLCTGRPASYAAVFDRSYREKVARISAWLDWITVIFNRSKGRRQMEEEPFVSITLQTMLETAYKNMLANKSLHVCTLCKKVYYDPDENSVTCSEECQRRHKDLEHYHWLKEHFQGHLVAGG